MSRAETLRKFDEIVDFADLGKFLDTEVAYYSSGMKARLGFAVAINVDADIFIADEALAVGDRPFKRKCKKRMDEIVQSGVTMFYVSHAPGLGAQPLQPRSSCSRRAGSSSTATSTRASRSWSTTTTTTTSVKGRAKDPTTGSAPTSEPSRREKHASRRECTGRVGVRCMSSRRLRRRCPQAVDVRCGVRAHGSLGITTSMLLRTPPASPDWPLPPDEPFTFEHARAAGVDAGFAAWSRARVLRRPLRGVYVSTRCGRRHRAASQAACLARDACRVASSPTVAPVGCTEPT